MPNNEMKTDELIGVLENYHKYIPTVDGKLQQVCFGGDQLTAARVWQAQQVHVNSTDTASALRGVVPFVCDWHAKVSVCIHEALLYNRRLCTYTYYKDHVNIIAEWKQDANAKYIIITWFLMLGFS